MINKSSIYSNGKYLNKNPDWHASDSFWKANQIDKIINRNDLSPRLICELGCGAGEILKQLSLKKNYESVKFFGFEISDAAFDLCKKLETENLKFLKEDFLKTSKKYDILLCIDVIEHVENYMEFVSSLKNKAEYKIFHIPLDLSVNSLITGSLLHTRETVGHLHYFTPDTAIATLIDCDYEIIDKMFTPSFASSPVKSIKTKIANISRKIFYSISPNMTSNLLGGVSMMVLAK